MRKHWNTSTGHELVLGQRHRFVLRKLVSAFVWLLLPALTLLASRSTPWEAQFRPRPFNVSYDAMFIAATAGIALASVWVLYATRARLVATDEPSVEPVLPIVWSWWNALDLFELMACVSLTAAYLGAGAAGSAVIWALALAVLGVLSARVAQTERPASLPCPPPRSRLSHTASIFLVAVALLFIAFPVLQPWSGPPEPFVRWHPFSGPAELVWRGFFLSFAAGMVLAAFDPLGRHRPFLVLLVVSGFLHAGEMAIDNLSSAGRGAMNGNPEHLYGDILGWFGIASVSLIFLIRDRRGG